MYSKTSTCGKIECKIFLMNTPEHFIVGDKIAIMKK